MASGWQQTTRSKFELAVELTRITFPYLIFISLVSLLVGRAQLADPLRGRRLRAGLAQPRPDRRPCCVDGPRAAPETAEAMAIAVLVGGVLQFALCWVSAAPGRASMLGLFRRPRLTAGGAASC